MRKVFFLVALLNILYACKKTVTQDVDGDSMRISILPLFEQGLNSFKLTGSMEVRKTSGEISYGLYIGKTINPAAGNAIDIPIGTSRFSQDFSYEVKDLDTGTLHYVRAYAKQNGVIEYSANQAISKVSPQITRSDTTLNHGRNFTFQTNITKFSPNTNIELWLDQIQIKVSNATSNFQGTAFTAELPDNVNVGKYNLILKVGQMKIAYPKKLQLLPGRWKFLTDLPRNASGFASSSVRFVINDWIFDLGLTAQGEPVFTKYNYSSGQQSTLSSLPGLYSYQKTAIIPVANKVHLISGEQIGNAGSWTPSKVHYVYDIPTDTWSREADFPGVARSGAVYALYGNKIYLGLGVHQASTPVVTNNYLTDMWSYDIQSKEWKRLGEFPDAGGSYMGARFVIGSNLYITAGVSKSGAYSTIPNKQTWCYDMLSDQWKKKASFPGQAEVSFANFSLNGFGYVGMGESATYNSYSGRNFVRKFYRYQINSDSWEEVSTAPDDSAAAFSSANADLGLLGAASGTGSAYKVKLFSFSPK